MGIMSATEAEQVKKRLQEGLVNEVQVSLVVEPPPRLFVPGRHQDLNRETQQLLEEMASLSEKIKLRVYDITTEPQEAEQRGVDKAPAIVLESDGNYNVKFYGFPGGYEFANLLDGLVKTSLGATLLSPETKEALNKLDQELHIQVFVTPT